MTDTSVIVAFLDPNNKSYSRSIKNINPIAAPDKIILWTKALIQATENTYVSTTLINRVPLD